VINPLITQLPWLCNDCCHMGLKYPVQAVICNFWHLDTDAQGWASECPDVKNYKWRLNPVWHRMLYHIWQQWASKG